MPPPRETLTHVVWGFLNTKTYTLVVLLHMAGAGVRVPLLVWLMLIDAILIMIAMPPLAAAQVMLLFGMHTMSSLFVMARFS